MVGLVTDSVTGRPIQGVPVTDGYTFTVTDHNGEYAFKGNSKTRTVYITVPAEYEIPMDSNHQPAYYKNGNFSSASQLYVNNFELTPRSSGSEKFALAVAADIHISNASDLYKFTNRALPDMISTLNDYCTGDYVQCVTLFAGDQFTDNLGMIQSFKDALTDKTVGGRKHAFLHCIGNHDFSQSSLSNYDGIFSDNASRTYVASQTFVDNFGPTDYSLNIGKAHIVVMNNMIVSGTGSGNSVDYTYGFTSNQLEWLKEDLNLVRDPQEKVLVLCVHAPIMGNLNYTNYQAVLQLLSRFNEGHIVSGHKHWVRNFEHDVTCAGGSKVYEHNLQMMGGMWWNTNLSVDGSPAGYSLMKFSGKKLYESVNKATGADLDHQIRVYSGNDSYYASYFSWTQGAGKNPVHTETYKWEDSLKGKFIARVWNADDDNWTVEFVQNGVSKPMTRLDAQQDHCTFAFSYLFHDRVNGGNTEYYSKLKNFWVIDAPCGNPANETGWKIVATHKASDSRTLTYERNVLQTDFSGFAYGASYPKNK